MIFDKIFCIAKFQINLRLFKTLPNKILILLVIGVFKYLFTKISLFSSFQKANSIYNKDLYTKFSKKLNVWFYKREKILISYEILAFYKDISKYQDFIIDNCNRKSFCNTNGIAIAFKFDTFINRLKNKIKY